MFSLGATLLYADHGEDGLNLDDLEGKLRQTQRPALAYTMPTFQDPPAFPDSAGADPADRAGRLGRDGAGRGRHLRRAAVRGEPAADAVRALGPARVSSTPSFSFTVAPGLRVGVFILPDELAAGVAPAAASTYITPALLGQATVFEFIRRGAFEPHLERLRLALRLRRDAMLSALDRHLPVGRWTRPEGGIFVQLQHLAQAGGLRPGAGRRGGRTGRPAVGQRP